MRIPTIKGCSTPDCLEVHYAKGFCQRCYQRSRYVPTGNPVGRNLNPPCAREEKTTTATAKTEKWQYNRNAK